ncbi:hypothetical protein BZG36_04315 [Bifiguratus adelaidae]|uniref:Amidase domain-containing protein n=1 Tax=Bifiguratus adelaidae TaxID=1938954 RepID=A0A261XZV0_9FUNG|nr:hypothetical protein BZG36_04315 [Bifiguratus adelaidae]
MALRSLTNRLASLDLSGYLSYLDSVLTRIKDYDETTLFAFVPEASRRDRLEAQAKLLFERYPEPSTRPPLFGVLVGVKDIYSCSESRLPTTGGSKLPSHLFDAPQSSLVSVLEKAGALTLGKTVTTEFAFYQPSVTRNPHNLERTPGGSSSGSAAAVAAGLCPIALGTQTNGSVIRPAAYCGVVGFKPTFNRVSKDGVLGVSSLLDTVGWFAKDIDSIDVVSSLAVPDWRDYKPSDSRNPERPVLGIPLHAYIKQGSPEALQAFEAHIATLQDAGYTVVPVPGMLDDIETVNASLHDLICIGLAKGHSSWFDQHQSLYSSTTVTAIQRGRTLSSNVELEAQVLQKKVSERLSRAMDEHKIDFWICPSTSSGIAPEIANTGNPVMNTPWSFVGWPAINLPASWDVDSHLPIGIQFVAEPNKDEQLLHWARSFEKVFAFQDM